MIAEYAEALVGRLSFDPALARSVRQEVEDHLWECVAADRTGDPREAERRAVARFGDPDIIAAQFAIGSLADQSRKVGLAVIVAIAGVLIAMKARIASYAVAQWALSDEMRALSFIVGSVDRYAFWLSAVVGIVGWAYVSRRSPALLHPPFRKQLRRCFLFCAVAAVALVTTVLSDGVLTTLRLLETGAAQLFIPIVSMAVEIVCVTLLVVRVRAVSRRMAATAALLRI
jgi:HAAS domain-containing protein